jgi:hypothetical protein
MRARPVVLVVAGSLLAGCSARVPVPPPGANSGCVQQCQQNHAVCLQGTSAAPAGAYGNADAALVGGLLQFAISQSGRSHCAEALQSCYAGCGQTMTQAQASLADYCQQLRCPDGGPGLWVGQARSLGLAVGVAVYMCRTPDSRVVGQWGCAQIMTGVGCVTDGGVLSGTNNGNAVKLTSSPLPGGRVSRCDFDGQMQGLGMAGNYACSGAIGTVSGTFQLARCP